MDIHRSMKLFIEVAKCKSIALAGRKLHLSAPSATRLLNELEEWLGQPLVRRTTRHVSLTELGESYLPVCIEITEKTDLLRIQAQEKATQIQGNLKITTSDIFAKKVLIPVISSFIQKHPNVTIELNTSHQIVDFMYDKFDIAFRTGQLQDSTLIAKKVFDMNMMLVASPDFVNQYGVPTTSDELLSFPCLVCSMPAYGAQWPMMKGKSVSGPVVIDDGELICELTLKGHGIAYLPDLYVAEYLKNQKLIEILPSEDKDNIPLHSIFPPRDYISLAAKEFVAAVQESL